MLFNKEDLTKKPGDIVGICWVLNHIVDTLCCPQTWLENPEGKGFFWGGKFIREQCPVPCLITGWYRITMINGTGILGIFEGSP